jgi:subtilisin family serine protease
MEQKQINPSSNLQTRPGCATTLAYVGISLWMVIISLVDIYSNWMLEQSLYESATAIPDFRWINHLICSLLLFIPLLVAFFSTKTPRLKSSIQIWMLAAAFSLAAFPIKKLWITYQQGTTVLLILLLIVFLSGLYLYKRKHHSQAQEAIRKPSLGGLVVLVAAAMTLPWVLWGALGSISDTLLSICLGVVFAFFAVEVIYIFFFGRILSSDREIKAADFLLDGFVVAIFFIIAVTALGQNGSQNLLLVTLPITGWVLTYLALTCRDTAGGGKTYAGLLIGVALAMPLVWFDADELSLIISGSSGGTIDWAMKAAWVTFCVSLLIFCIALINLKVLSRIQLPKKANWIMAGISFSSLAIVYLLFGQTGFHGDKIFVVMKDQADLSDAVQIKDVSTRREAVYDTLVKTSEDTQTDIQKQLETWHLKFTPYYLVNGLEVDSNPYFTTLIENRDDVAKVLESPQLRPLPVPEPLINSDPVDKPDEPTWNLKMIGVDRVHSDLNITGKGIVIGQTDTGADGQHPQLSDSYRGASGSDDYNWLDLWNNSPYPTDRQGHGTATLGIITGKDIGIAPDAQWIGCVNLGRNLGNPAVYLDCMQFMLAPYPQGGNPFKEGNPSKGAMIVNNSWGCPKVEGCDSETYRSAVGALETAGIFMSVAAGNTGYYGCSTITDPLAIYPDVFTVGSIDKNGNVSNFSSLGPVTVDESGRVKPDLLAPGENVISAFPGNQHMQGSGTSFAAPHVSGVVALMWSANPALIGNIPLTREILDETATRYKGTVPDCVTDITSVPNDVSGYGLVNAYAAVEKALSLK